MPVRNASNGVTQNDLKAFQYFRAIADNHADDNPQAPQARFVANAFVALGHYYRDGIPDSPVRPDADRARHMFWYAASYFADPDAQYHLGRLYVDGKMLPKDSVQAARWFRLAANKGHHVAQATLGGDLRSLDVVKHGGDDLVDRCWTSGGNPGQQTAL